MPKTQMDKPDGSGMALLFDQEISVAELDAHPARVGSVAANQPVVKAATNHVHFLDDCAGRQPSAGLCRIKVAAQTHYDATLSLTTNHLPS